ncbi:MAG: FAD-dependent oxidoreductase [Solirubrobacterales bacterium]
MTARLHVVGAGLAGLACAVAAARAGMRVSLYEAAAHAGGRCRSFRDERLDRVIDNGTHLLIGANRTALMFAAAIGGDEAMAPQPPLFPMMDMASGDRWMIEGGRLPAGWRECASALGLPWVGRQETVAMRLGPTASFERIWRPLCEAVTNTPPEDCSARLFARVLRTAMLKGRRAMAPVLFPVGVSAAFAAPALATLAVHGATVEFGRRLLAARPGELVFEDRTVRLSSDDRVVLALPPWIVAGMLPDIPQLPTSTIVNAHYRLDVAPHGPAMLGLVGGTAQWLFTRDDLVSVTVSAADRLADRPADEIAALLWRDAARALRLAPSPPPYRVLKERRATLAHTPDAVGRRPGATTCHPWLFLAGDWLASPWPCTIEAAVASGLAAARLAMARPNLSFAV